MNPIRSEFGDIDIYLFDQLQKGTFLDCKKIVDLGCGRGRNLHYFIKHGYDVWGIDASPAAISEVRSLALELNSDFPVDQLIHADLDNYAPFEKESFDLVICSAVLHFAKDEEHFDEMIRAAWSLLKPGGYFFARLASEIGIEDLIIPLGNRRFILPDGTERFLVDEDMILDYNRKLNAKPYEFLKTTLVQNSRSMTTWCIQK
jgi:tellurite methyltransferase